MKLSGQRPALRKKSIPAIQSYTGMQAKNHTGMPTKLKAGIEHLSGLSMDAVKVHHNSSRPAQLQALAYCQGTDIHVGPGQEKHLPHEAWHVVQQQQGRVKPTLQTRGLSINDDDTLEREADVMGAKAAAHKASESLESLPAGPMQVTPVFAIPVRVRQAGNLSGDVAQCRLPSKEQVIVQLGEAAALATADRPYRALLRGLKALDKALEKPLSLLPQKIQLQLLGLLARFDTVIETCDQVLEAEAAPQSAKSRYTLRLKLNAQNEKTQAMGPMMHAIRDRSHYGGEPLLAAIINPSESLTVDNALHQGAVGGV